MGRDGPWAMRQDGSDVLEATRVAAGPSLCWSRLVLALVPWAPWLQALRPRGPGLQALTSGGFRKQGYPFGGGPLRDSILFGV